MRSSVRKAVCPVLELGPVDTPPDRFRFQCCSRPRQHAKNGGIIRQAQIHESGRTPPHPSHGGRERCVRASVHRPVGGVRSRRRPRRRRHPPARAGAAGAPSECRWGSTQTGDHTDGGRAIGRPMEIRGTGGIRGTGAARPPGASPAQTLPALSSASPSSPVGPMTPFRHQGGGADAAPDGPGGGARIAGGALDADAPPADPDARGIGAVIPARKGRTVMGSLTGTRRAGGTRSGPSSRMRGVPGDCDAGRRDGGGRPGPHRSGGRGDCGAVGVNGP